MECQVSQQGDTVLFRLSGKVDEQGAELLKQHFKALSLHKVRHLTIDMAECSYMGSSGIGKLLLFYKHLAGHDGTLALIEVPGAIAQLFRELKLDTLFTISPA